MRVLITGGTNGMGKGAARALAARPDVELIILGRSQDNGDATLAELSAMGAAGRVSFVLCDLTRLRDVRVAITELHDRHSSLDALFVNAGLGYRPERVETEDGLLEHFQVNYLSHFMLILGLLDLLEASDHGGRVVFNATDFGTSLDWDDLQMTRKWGYEAAVVQGMVAKRMLIHHLHDLHRREGGPDLSFFGFQVPKTVWSNQLAIIPAPMRIMATVMKWFGRFISIDASGRMMVPLFVDGREQTLVRSGRLLTWKNGVFEDVDEASSDVLDPAQRQKLWEVSKNLCDDDGIREIAMRLESGA
ncbi:MAG: SDR family NAD(P)-dependent oxidoreductase [Trueperaceae bacterium]|nr:MAG: SDR family NAD(P)-dependent oxidoreductase [Trueperaceae bacterium]